MFCLTIINKSDYGVYMNLAGSYVNEAFYYLTIPTGSRDQPTVKNFTIMQDVYSRKTWACDGFRTTGQLFVTGNLRLTFTPCGVKLPTVTLYWRSRNYLRPNKCCCAINTKRANL